MQYLFGSEISLLAFRFRDYIRAQFSVEVELREVQDQKGNELSFSLMKTHLIFKLF